MLRSLRSKGRQAKAHRFSSACRSSMLCPSAQPAEADQFRSGFMVEVTQWVKAEGRGGMIDHGASAVPYDS